MSKFKPYRQDQPFLLPPSLHDFVPEGHLASILSEVIEQLDISQIENKYSPRGQKSYPPRLLLKLLFYGYATGVRSGRKIAARCQTDTAFMYLAQLYRPDFRTLNDFRKNNLEAFAALFKQVLQLCRQLGMAHAGLIAIDSTKIRASASVRKSKDLEKLEKLDKQLEEQIAAMLKEAEENERQEDELYGKQNQDDLPKELKKKQLLRQKIEKAKQELQKHEQLKKANLTDAEAPLIKGTEGTKPHYNCQAAVTEDGIIVGAYATSDANDRAQLLPAIAHVEENLEIEEQAKKQERVWLADSGYSSYENYEQLDKQQRQAYIPDQEFKPQEEPAAYDRSRFSYQPAQDEYLCPQQQRLVFKRHYHNKTNKQRSRIYEGLFCSQCPVRDQCTTGQVRRIYREEREDLREQMRQKLSSEEGKAIYKKRLHLIESRFAHLKYNLGYRMMSMRGLAKADAEFKLMCLVHNLLKICAKKAKRAAQKAAVTTAAFLADINCLVWSILSVQQRKTHGQTV